NGTKIRNISVNPLESKHQSKREGLQARLVRAVLKEIIEIIFRIDAESTHPEPGKRPIAELRKVIVIFKLLFTQLVTFEPLRPLDQEAPFRPCSKPQSSYPAVVFAAPLERKG